MYSVKRPRGREEKQLLPTATTKVLVTRWTGVAPLLDEQHPALGWFHGFMGFLYVAYLFFAAFALLEVVQQSDDLFTNYFWFVVSFCLFATTTTLFAAYTIYFFVQRTTIVEKDVFRTCLRLMRLLVLMTLFIGYKLVINAFINGLTTTSPHFVTYRIADGTMYITMVFIFTSQYMGVFFDEE